MNTPINKNICHGNDNLDSNYHKNWSKIDKKIDRLILLSHHWYQHHVPPKHKYVIIIFHLSYPDNWELADVKLYRAAQVSRYIWLARYKCEHKNFLNSNSLEEHNYICIMYIWREKKFLTKFRLDFLENLWIPPIL